MVNADLGTVLAMMQYARVHVFDEYIRDPDEVEVTNFDGEEAGWCCPDEADRVIFGIDGPFQSLDDIYLTVLHEMLHLWQIQVGVPVGHDENFIRIENELIETTDFYDMRRYVGYNSGVVMGELENV
jgi:hypothetical protein